MVSHIRTMFHTQEKRGMRLTSPIKCGRDDAWLGEGYYFWDDLNDAKQWGNKSKRKTGAFEIYRSEIDIENFLDTVFNEAHYRFWVRQIEKAAKVIQLKSRTKPTIKEINEYFKEKALWDEVDGILFQDLPINENLSKVKSFYYRKRIQAVVYNVEKIINFVFHFEGKCN